MNIIMMMSINSVIQYDSAVWKYITYPVGTRLVRASEEEFEKEKI